MMRLLSINPATAQRKLEESFAKSVNGPIRNAVLHVDAPRLGIHQTWARGIADERTGEPMRSDTPFLSASVGKIAMAATAFDLAASGIIDIDAPVSEWVPTSVIDLLPIAGGASAAERITIRTLLANRSGLPDYFDSDTHPAADGAPSVGELMVGEPERTWNREQLIDYAATHYEPFAEPGERFLYSDLNWDLLGLVFESATNQPFHKTVRDRVLNPLGMTQTWYHVFEPSPEGVSDYADIFSGETNLARKPSLTLDQAGGGLANTAEDLARLIRGLEKGTPVGLDVLGSDWTKDAMSRGLDYGYGTWRWRPGRVFFLLWRFPHVKGVSGSNNSFAYVTDRGDVITGTMNQLDDPSRHVKFILSRVMSVLARTKEVEADV